VHATPIIHDQLSIEAVARGRFSTRKQKSRKTKAVLTLLKTGFLVCTTRGVYLAGVLLGAGAASALEVGALAAVTLGWAAFSLLLLGFAAPAVPRGVAFASPPAIFTCNTICASLRSHTLFERRRENVYFSDSCVAQVTSQLKSMFMSG
jgi:hypothetical protein